MCYHGEVLLVYRRQQKQPQKMKDCLSSSTSYSFARPHLWFLLMGPVLQSQLKQRVINALWGVGLHCTHVLQESFQLSWIVGKDGDELLRVGLRWQGRKRRPSEWAWHL